MIVSSKLIYVVLQRRFFHLCILFCDRLYIRAAIGHGTLLAFGTVCISAKNYIKECLHQHSNKKLLSQQYENANEFISLMILATVFKFNSLWNLSFIRPLQINSLFPVLDSGIFACGRSVHFHYFIIRLASYSSHYLPSTAKKAA